MDLDDNSPENLKHLSAPIKKIEVRKRNKINDKFFNNSNFI